MQLRSLTDQLFSPQPWVQSPKPSNNANSQLCRQKLIGRPDSCENRGSQGHCSVGKQDDHCSNPTGGRIPSYPADVYCLDPCCPQSKYDSCKSLGFWGSIGCRGRPGTQDDTHILPRHPKRYRLLGNHISQRSMGGKGRLPRSVNIFNCRTFGH